MADLLRTAVRVMGMRRRGRGGIRLGLEGRLEGGTEALGIRSAASEVETSSNRNHSGIKVLGHSAAGAALCVIAK